MDNVGRTNGQSSVHNAQNKQKIQNTKTQINKVVNTIMVNIPQDQETQSKIAGIARKLYEYADKYNGAVSKEEFTKLLKLITPEIVVGVIIKYNNVISPDESIIEMMLDEVGSDKEDIREALIGQGNGKNKLEGLFTVLLNRARAVGMDETTIGSYRAKFKKELNKELDGAALLRSSKKMDELVDAVIKSIENHIEENNNAAKSDKTEPITKQEINATNYIVKRYNKAQKDFKAQMDYDGWAENVADAMGRIWGKNYADEVRKDLKIAETQIERLKAALAKGDKAFKSEFLNIFGITYDPANIKAYENTERIYTQALKAKGSEEAFQTEFSLLLNGKSLTSETKSSTTSSIKGGTYTSLTVVKEEEVYQREFNKVAELFDSIKKYFTVKDLKSFGINDSEEFIDKFAQLKDGKSILEKAIELEGANNKPIGEKYKVLQKIVLQINKSLVNETLKACGGRSFESVQKQYENSYKAAFGVENDILKRVTDYNMSQIKGGGAVKGTSIAIAAIVVGILTSGVGSAAVAGGTGAAVAGNTATTAAMLTGALKSGTTIALTSAAVEISDRFTSKEALDALKKDGVLAFLKKGAEVTDWKQVAKTSLISGALGIAFAGGSYVLTNLTVKAATAAGLSVEAAGYTAAGVSTAGFIGTGLGVEYVLQGEITVEDTAFTVVMALIAGTMQVIQVYKASQAAKTQANSLAEQFEQGVKDAREILGLSDNIELTAKNLKDARNAAIKMAHPDLVGEASTELAAKINGAYKFLSANIDVINAKVAPTATQQPAAQANPTKSVPQDGALVVKGQSAQVQLPKEQPIVLQMQQGNETNSIERRINAYNETLEFRPDKTFVKYDKEGNIIKTDIWEEIDGKKITLFEAKNLWTGDHLGYHPLEPNFLSKIGNFINTAQEPAQSGNNGTIRTNPNAPATDSGNTSATAGGATPAKPQVDAQTQDEFRLLADNMDKSAQVSFENTGVTETTLNTSYVGKFQTAKAESSLKRALYSSKSVQEFNKTEFQKWADENGLELTYSDDMQRAIFLDEKGNMVRIINADRNNLARVYDDTVNFFDNNHHKTGTLKRTVGGTDIYLSETDGKTYIKNKNGIWEEYKTKEVPINNPITGEPQLQVHQTQPSPASFEKAGIPETTLSASYVEAPQTVSNSAHPSVNDIVAKYENPDISSFSETTNLPLGNGTRTDYKSGNNLVLTVFRDSNNKITSTLENIYDSNGKYIKTVETKADGSVIETTLDKLNTGHPELQVHEAEPAPASFENAGVPETTLSASYVENLRASDSSSKFMSNIDNITKRALGEGRIRQSFYDKVQNAKTTEDLANCISDISSDTEGAYIKKIIELTSKAEPGNAQLKQLANDANIMRNIYSDFNSFAIRGSKNITELKPVIEQFAQQHGYTVENGKDDWGFDCIKVKNAAGKTIREVSADIRGNILEDEWFTYDANGNVVRNVSYDRGGEPTTIIQHYYKNGVETHSTGVDKGRDIAKVYVYENGEPSVSYMHSDKVKATFGHELEGKELLDEPQQSSVPQDGALVVKGQSAQVQLPKEQPIVLQMQQGNETNSIERRINAYNETLEFRPDKTFVKYDKEGNIIKTDIWEEIDGKKITLFEAKNLWTGDHLGYHPLEPNFLSKIGNFINTAQEPAQSGNNGTIRTNPNAPATDSGNTSATAGGAAPAKPQVDAQTQNNKNVSMGRKIIDSGEVKILFIYPGKYDFHEYNAPLVRYEYKGKTYETLLSGEGLNKYNVEDQLSAMIDGYDIGYTTERGKSERVNPFPKPDVLPLYKQYGVTIKKMGDEFTYYGNRYKLSQKNYKMAEIDKIQDIERLIKGEKTNGELFVWDSNAQKYIHSKNPFTEITEN